jgi:thiol-disulfide isomerase/thioredoxin
LSNRRILVIASILFAIVIIFHFYSKKHPEADEPEKVLDSFKKPFQWQGRYAPDFEIDLISGEKFRLSDHIGEKVIILNFFATWCGPCKQEMPELIGFYEKHKEDPFILLGINASENESRVKEFIQKLRLNFPVGLDKSDKIQRLYAVRSYPTTVLIGSDGRVQVYEIGQIMNADIAFDTFLRSNINIIKHGKGVEKEAYLKDSNQQKGFMPGEKEPEDKDRLEGRARTIAEKMRCPCGCSHLIVDCNCKTAKDVKNKIRTENLSGRTDEEIIKGLNKEFCAGSENKKDDHS